jgi:NDP-sugar pyrophosphorylase family protein
MKAFILVGGSGSRLYPITYYIPKPLIPINGKPIIGYIIEHLKQVHADEYVLCCSQDTASEFNYFLDDGSRFGVNISYSVGAKNLATSGRLAQAREHVDGTFAVYYGDIITDFDLTDMVRLHQEKKATATIALCNSHPISVGLADVAADGKLLSFVEKPVLENYLVSIGVYIFEPVVLDYCRHDRDVASHVIPALIEDKRRVFGYVTNRKFWDIGTLSALDEVQNMFRNTIKEEEAIGME